MRRVLYSVLFMFPASALACDAPEPITALNKDVGVIAEKVSRHDYLRTSEKVLWKQVQEDQHQMDSLRALVKPACVEHDARDTCADAGKPDCEVLEPTELLSMPNLEQHRRYKLPADQRAMIETQIEQLISKWSSP